MRVFLFLALVLGPVGCDREGEASTGKEAARILGEPTACFLGGLPDGMKVWLCTGARSGRLLICPWDADRPCYLDLAEWEEEKERGPR